MNSTTFYDKSVHILSQLNVGPILEITDRILAPPNVPLGDSQEKLPSLLLRIKATLTLLNEDPENHAIINAFKLPEIFADRAIAEMIAAVRHNTTSNGISSNDLVRRVFSLFHSRLQRLQEFLEAFNKLVIQPREHVADDTEELLSFDLPDYNDDGLDIERLRDVLELIQRLHDNIARATETESRVTIAYLDSGSNSLITVKAKIRVIDELRQLIIDVWDRIRFGKAEAYTRKLEAATAGVRFVEFIDQQQKAGKIDPAAASQFKHVAISDAVSLFEKGASVTEVQRDTVINNRELLRAAVVVKELEDGPAPRALSPRDVPPRDE
jgi:hypothetical protein